MKGCRGSCRRWKSTLCEVRTRIVVRHCLSQPVARDKLVFLRSARTSVVVPVLAGVLVTVDTGILDTARATACLRLTALQDDQSAEEGRGGEHEEGTPVADVMALVGAHHAQTGEDQVDAGEKCQNSSFVLDQRHQADSVVEANEEENENDACRLENDH